MKTILIGLLLVPQLAFATITEAHRLECLRHAPVHYAEVNVEFQRYLGRDALPAEASHFGALLADGYKPSDVAAALVLTDEYKSRMAPREVNVCHQSSFVEWLSAVSPIIAAAIAL